MLGRHTLPILLMLPVLVQANERTALDIGNADYVDAPLLSLVNHARAIDKQLTKLGFKATRLV